MPSFPAFRDASSVGSIVSPKSISVAPSSISLCMIGGFNGLIFIPEKSSIQEAVSSVMPANNDEKNVLYIFFCVFIICKLKLETDTY